MKVEKVTLTGCDDNVDPAKMLEFSQEFPMVEWGILFSKNRTGKSRYPSANWVERLSRVVYENPNMKLAAHLCGKWVEDILSGELTFVTSNPFADVFERLQLNLGSSNLKILLQNNNVLEMLKNSKRHHDILIGGNYDTCDFNYFSILKKYCLGLLYDASGGNGTSPRQWPKHHGCFKELKLCTGYAGGLNPENLHHELIRISDVAEGKLIWIDMESGIRQNEEFSFDKARRILEIVHYWNGDQKCIQGSIYSK